MSLDELDPGVAIVATYLRHVTLLAHAMAHVTGDLEARARIHDLSKLTGAELPGFARLSAAVRGLKYGTQEYRDAMAEHKAVGDAHANGNSHHPEYHLQTCADRSPTTMGWLDIVEMVCDWWAASRTYGPGGDFRRSVHVGLDRWDWSTHQQWLINQVARTLRELE